MEEYNVHQALKILKEYYITDSIQMVTRWIRENRIKAERTKNKKDGWQIYHDDLFDFIEEERPGLPEIMGVYKWYVDSSLSSIVTVNNNMNNKNIGTETKNNHAVVDASIIENKTTDLIKVKNENNDIQVNSELFFEEINDLMGELLIIQTEMSLLKNNIAELITRIQDQSDNLNRQVDKLFKELKSQQSNNSSLCEIRDSKLNEEMTLYELKKILHKEINDYDGEKTSLMEKIDDLAIETHNLYFNEDGTIQGKIINGSFYVCPLSGKSYKNLKTMVKNAIRIKLKSSVNISLFD